MPKPNRLIHEKSPYLLQHAHNPVEWYPWGDEAFETARRLGKPVFLSVGYATCHWCHVMERESFEDSEAAAALNDSFVCIKVDREERPDIDAVYMAACHLVTGSGGWPLTIVMTSERKPFFAGTYLPKESRFGRLGVLDLCRRITELARSEPARVDESAQTIVGHLGDAFQFESDPSAHADPTLLDAAAQQIAGRFDAQFGGFESAPKFPMPHRLEFLLRTYERTHDERLLRMVTHTLSAMRLGGIWDHVGFGFHRYATDREWLLPHFEKMLYDQALLVPVYLRAFRITADPLFAQTAREILAYVLREMTAPEGGFYAAQDADSEGEEGKFYVWSQTEFERLAGGRDEGIPWGRIFRVEPEGNFADEATKRKAGTNILHLARPLSEWALELKRDPADLAHAWERLRARLFSARAERVPPLKDDKILTDWNGLMIAAMAQAGDQLADKAYLDAARGAARFVLSALRDQSGMLLHRHRDGESAIRATANDYAFLIMGLIELARATGEEAWRREAARLQGEMNLGFADPTAGGFFLTAADQHDLPVRPKEVYDGALPSANAVALSNLLHLADLTAKAHWRQQATDLIRAFGGSVRRQPGAYTQTLNGWALMLSQDA
jgi:uncharacterized protein